mgnify:CR=1 FL=1
MTGITPLVFIALLIIGVPIGLVLCLAAFAYILASGNAVLLESYPLKLFSSLDNFGLLAIPLFILIGEIMNGAGITTRLVRLASAFIGAVRGGLAYVNLLANMFVASILGSATRTTSMSPCRSAAIFIVHPFTTHGVGC